MGGGGRYPYPKHVWSPAGGWWCHPKQWRQSTGRAFVAAGGFFAFVLWLERGSGRGHYQSDLAAHKPYSTKGDLAPSAAPEVVRAFQEHPYGTQRKWRTSSLDKPGTF
eukprot:CAMPEP_0175115686 /NCGR_PEP_ID=MMETSP0086_2-20121207/17744_1 /TAXON_ID=136419 /ORGANISM="Unknown Unknown, Strain D1" /LENGTH=107 /DNA_ID=CAMNT_0016395863 /DNA_START=27 /DNA_END=350 /DNA_ORIENTATION=+